MNVLIIGAGPSLDENLKDLKRLGGFSGYMICTDGAINKVLEAGLVPDAVTTLEDTPDLNKYYITDIVKEKGHLIKDGAIISDRVHNNARMAMKAAQIQPRVTGDLRGYITSNVGLFSWLYAVKVMNSKNIYMIGMDHCYGEFEKPKVDRTSKLFELAFKVRVNPYDKKEVILHPAYELWTEEFEWYGKENPDVRTVNLTGRGALYDSYFIWRPIRDIQNEMELYR